MTISQKNRESAEQMARKFSAQSSTAQRGLVNVMGKMGVSSYKWIVENGNKITIMFILEDKDGAKREYHYICDKYDHVDDNFRAAQLSLDYLYRIYEDYGIRTEEQEECALETIFQGFRVLKSQERLLALPDPSTRSPWEVLGIRRDSTHEDVERAYKEYAKVHHPDRPGGEYSDDADRQ